jgi:hypothetical protein
MISLGGRLRRRRLRMGSRLWSGTWQTCWWWHERMGLFVWCVTVGQGWWWHDGAGGRAWVPCVIIGFGVSIVLGSKHIPELGIYTWRVWSIITPIPFFSFFFNLDFIMVLLLNLFLWVFPIVSAIHTCQPDRPSPGLPSCTVCSFPCCSFASMRLSATERMPQSRRRHPRRRMRRQSPGNLPPE